MRNHVLVIACCCLYVLLLSATKPLFLSTLVIFSLAVLCLPLLLRLYAAITRPTDASASLPIPPLKGRDPFVTIIMACANEPYTIVNPNLRAIAKQLYKKYEVLVLDNNNTNRENYKRIQEECKKLGRRFKFRHVDHVNGFKAGALNLAMKYLDKRTEVLAMVDADYRLKPDFLKTMAAHFADPCVGIVQAPQDYSDGLTNRGLFYDFRAYFSILMNQAQLSDAVTFTGTLGMIRRNLFSAKALRWNEWCITEDTEAGVFIHSLGYKGRYIDKTFGHGFMPLTYSSLLRQRARWSFGNAQILHKDILPILFNRSFSWRQKLSFATQLSAWLHAELAVAIALVTCAINWALYHDPVILTTEKFCLAVLAASFIVNVLFFLIGLRSDRLSLRERLTAFVAHYGTAFAMSYSWLYFAFGGRMGFRVTKKTKSAGQRKDVRYINELLMPLLLTVALVVLLMQRQLGIAITLLPLIALIAVTSMGIWYLSNNFRRAA